MTRFKPLRPDLTVQRRKAKVPPYTVATAVAIGASLVSPKKVRHPGPVRAKIDPQELSLRGKVELAP
jgi:hypothetical protein